MFSLPVYRNPEVFVKILLSFHLHLIIPPLAKALRLTLGQHTVWGLILGVKQLRCEADHSSHLVPIFRMSEVTSTPPYAFMVCTGKPLPLSCLHKINKNVVNYIFNKYMLKGMIQKGSEKFCMCINFT